MKTLRWTIVSAYKAHKGDTLGVALHAAIDAVKAFDEEMEMSIAANPAAADVKARRQQREQARIARIVLEVAAMEFEMTGVVDETTSSIERGIAVMKENGEDVSPLQYVNVFLDEFVTNDMIGERPFTKFFSPSMVSNEEREQRSLFFRDAPKPVHCAVWEWRSNRPALGIVTAWDNWMTVRVGDETIRVDAVTLFSIGQRFSIRPLTDDETPDSIEGRAEAWRIARMNGVLLR